MCCTRQAGEPPDGGPAGVRLRAAQDRRRSAPICVEEGWLLIHHGASGDIAEGWDPTTQNVEYAAGAMLLDADDPSRVIARTDQPILDPETVGERDGVVSNVVFPTAIESVEGVRYVFYGMADAKIGVARLHRT